MFAQIQSRHKGRIKYKCYVKYVPLANVPSGIEFWYCNCLSRNRTVGCCSHISSLIYYFSCGKYLDSIPDPAGELSNFFTTVICESTDDSDHDNDFDEDSVTEKSQKIKKTKKVKNIDIFSESEEEEEILSQNMEFFIF